MSRPGHGPNGWVVYTQGQQPKATLGGRPFGRKPLAAELEASCTPLPPTPTPTLTMNPNPDPNLTPNPNS